MYVVTALSSIVSLWIRAKSSWQMPLVMPVVINFPMVQVIETLHIRVLDSVFIFSAKVFTAMILRYW